MGDAYLREHPNPNSRGYTSPRRSEPSGVGVVHTAETPPDFVGGDGAAEAVAHYETVRTTPGSYHDLCDSDTIIQLVRYADAAWHDGTGTNHHSYGVSGATQADSWDRVPKDYSTKLVKNMAKAAARYAHWIYDLNGTVIPAKRITATEARNRVPGWISHAELDPSRRTDPGKDFPWDIFLAEFARLTQDINPTATKDWLDMATKAEVQEAFVAAQAPVLAKLDEIEDMVTTLKRHTVVGADAAQGDPTVPDRIIDSLTRIETNTAPKV